jgi:hypothetical protein
MRFPILHALPLAAGVLGISHVVERDTTDGIVEATKKFIVEVTAVRSPMKECRDISAHL